jgi:hypothetical protein
MIHLTRVAQTCALESRVAVLACILVCVGSGTLAAAVASVAARFPDGDAAALSVVFGVVVAFLVVAIPPVLSKPSSAVQPSSMSSPLSRSPSRPSVTSRYLYVQRDGIIRTLSPNNYGDLPLHLTYIAYFVKGARFWPANPIFAGESLHYPFGVRPLHRGAGQARRADRHRPAGPRSRRRRRAAIALFAWGRGFAVAAFLFSGGLAGFELLWTGVSRTIRRSWPGRTCS